MNEERTHSGRWSFISSTSTKTSSLDQIEHISNGYDDDDDDDQDNHNNQVDEGGSDDDHSDQRS